jgi:CheY-like chemotaxis protein
MSRILIVEDDPAILCGLRDNLEFESHQVLTAADGEAGYRAVCEHTPDLVILDLMLPKLSGYDLCRRVRAKGFNAPILMLSARSQEGDRVVGLDLGANDYVSKPFSLRELLARVRALLRHEREHHLDEEWLTSELKMAAKVQQGVCFRRFFPTRRGWIMPEFAGPRAASAAITTISWRSATENWDCCWRTFPARECRRRCWERRCTRRSARMRRRGFSLRRGAREEPATAFRDHHA